MVQKTTPSLQRGLLQPNLNTRRAQLTGFMTSRRYCSGLWQTLCLLTLFPGRLTFDSIIIGFDQTNSLATTASPFHKNVLYYERLFLQPPNHSSPVCPPPTSVLCAAVLTYFYDTIDFVAKAGKYPGRRCSAMR